MSVLHPSPSDAASCRSRLWDAGFRPVAVYNHDASHSSPGKAPKGDAWQDRARRNPPDAAIREPDPEALNTGIMCDGLRAIDLDVDNLTLVHALRRLATQTLGETITRTRDNSGRALMLYRAATGEPLKRVMSGRLGKVEVLGRGQQFVAFGVHPSGAALRWLPESPSTFAADSLPAVTEDQVGDFLQQAADIIGGEPEKARAAGLAVTSQLGLEADALDVAAALAVISNAASPDWECWNRTGMATWAATGGAEAGFVAWCAWSSRNPTHDEAACRERWDHYRAAPPTRIGAASLFHMARQARPGWTKPSAGLCAQAPAEPTSEPNDPGPPEGATIDPPPFCTDDALALCFSDRYADQLRHVSSWGKWLEWNGTHWRHDPTLATFDRARAICRAASKTCNDPRVSAKVASASTVAAVERLAKADRRHAATVEQWDADPWLLNTPGGTVDLRTGKMRKHLPADHLTKITAVAPGGECPMWHKFLATVTNNDADLQANIKRMAGYALTGSIREHALFFAFGTGANGKGVAINTLTGIMGDYAAVAGIETFTASTSDRHPTDLAMLRGARLVTAQETEEGRRWAESRIKSMTGGDPITARFMRQDFFTFQPTFKLLIAGNHRPGLRGVDEAIRRRFHLVPFAVRIAQDKRDLDLPEKLKVEWPGILKWAVEGCLEW